MVATLRLQNLSESAGISGDVPYLIVELRLIINPCMPSVFFYFNSLDKFISYIRGVWLVFIIVMFYRNS